MGVPWNHWFWVTFAFIVAIYASQALGESLRIDPAGQHLSQEGEEYPQRINSSEEHVSVSQSSSVSKVSVRFGGISVRQKDHPDTSLVPGHMQLPHFRRQKKLPIDKSEKTSIEDVETRIRQSFFQRLLSKLKSLASIRVDEEVMEEDEAVDEEIYNAIDYPEVEHGYQLVYKDEDTGDYIDYEEDPIVYFSDSQEYTDHEYLEYEVHDPERLSGLKSENDEIIIELKNEVEEEVDEQTESAIINNELLGEDVASSVRSPEARGRALVIHEDDLEEEDDEEEEEEEAVWSLDVSRMDIAGDVGVTLPNMDFTMLPESTGKLFEEVVSDSDKAVNSDRSEEEIIDDVEVVIDKSTVEILTFRNKLGIFIGVIMIALTISVILGVVAVSVGRARRGKLMMKEDEMSHTDTVSTVMETGSYSGLPDSVYSDYIRKSSLSCDELTELDNDSFLTSLETISVMDRFGWE